MPPTPLAGNAVTDTPDEAGAPGTRVPAPATPGHRPRTDRPLLPRRFARRAQTTLPAVACSDRPGSVRAEIRGDRLRRLAGLLRRVLATGAHYYDPLFEQPDLVEDDYYRFRNQPRGW